MSETALHATTLPDPAGEVYHEALKRLHEVCRPQTHFEIGTEHGNTLAHARCKSLAVDPRSDVQDIDVVKRIMTKPALSFFQMRSDDFFARYNLTQILSMPIDIAMLDGMHQCEFLLRDFINTERHCNRNSIIALHDCLPVETASPRGCHTATGPPSNIAVIGGLQINSRFRL